jgi:two-component SAPR family response regulator
MNIIIVEDEEITLEEIKDIVLRFSNSLEITTCNNPFIALEMSNKKTFDIALLDIEMPYIKGIELAEKLYQKLPHIKIAFVTAYNNYATEAFELYAIDYVLKPIREERLEMCLRRLVDAVNETVLIDSPHVRIKAFGRLRVWIDGNLVVWKRKKAYEVFAYLLTNHDNAMRKEKIIDDIFPEFNLERGTVHLQTVISHIRKLGFNVQYFDNAYMYSIVGVEYDVEELLQAYNFIKKTRSLNSKDKVLEILDLYKAPFLEEDGFLWGLPNTIYLENTFMDFLDILLTSAEVISDPVLPKKILTKKKNLEE